LGRRVHVGDEKPSLTSSREQDNRIQHVTFRTLWMNT